MRSKKYAPEAQKKFKNLYSKVAQRIKRGKPLDTDAQYEMSILIDTLTYYETLKEEFMERWIEPKGSYERR